MHSTEYWVILKISHQIQILVFVRSRCMHLPSPILTGPALSSGRHKSGRLHKSGSTKVGGGTKDILRKTDSPAQRVPHVTAGVYSTHFIHPLPEIPSTNDFIYSTNFLPFLSKFTASAQRGAFFGDGPCGLCGK